MSVRVLKPGVLTTLQDAGRPGHAALGLGRAGAMDPPAWRLANALVGNRGDEATLECSLLGPQLRFERAGWFALTGGTDQALLDGRSVLAWSPVYATAGAVLTIGPLSQGCRAYLALRGGIALPALLGSRASDLHGALMVAAPLRADDLLPLGEAPPCPGLPDDGARAPRWGIDPRPWRHPPGRPLGLLPGSHQSALREDARRALHGPWRVGLRGNRTALRLEGPSLALQQPLELISEAALPGTIQLPPAGQPIVLLAEAPVTGGYPRIGQVAQVELAALAQSRPGDIVSFEAISMAQAWQRLSLRQLRLDRLLAAIARRLENPA